MNFETEKNMPDIAESAPENLLDFIGQNFDSYENFKNHVVAKAKEAERYHIRLDSKEFIEFIFEDYNLNEISSATKKALKATVRGIIKEPKEKIKDERLIMLEEAERKRKIRDAYGHEKHLGGNED